MNRPFLTGLILATILAAVVAAEVQVNERTSGTQANPAVAADGAGGFIIVWSSYFTTVGRSNDILARRLDANGAFRGTEFLVNVGTERNQTEPAVASNSRGDLAVVWQGLGPDMEDVYVRRFDPNGAATTDDLQVNLNTAGRQLYPNAAMSHTGTLAVVWESRTTMEDGDRFLVCAQLCNPDGSGRAGEIIVDDPTLDCRYPDVAMDGAGNFVVTWLRETGTDTIMARQFDPNGVPVTEPFAVSTVRLTSITRPLR